MPIPDPVEGVEGATGQLTWDSREITAGLQAVSSCRQGLLIHVKQLLDGYHGERRSIDYYDLILGDWLEHFAHLAFAAWREVTANAGDMRVAPLMTAPVTGTTREFLSTATRNPQINRFLKSSSSALLASCALPIWQFSASSFTIACHRSSRWRKGWIKRIGRSDAPVLVCAPHFKCSPTEWLTGLARLRRLVRWDDLEYEIRVTGKVDGAWRATQASSAGHPTDFLGLLRALLPLLLPAVFLEGFSQFRAAALDCRIRTPRVAYTAVGLHGHLIFKILAAEWRETGTTLLNHQHGGGYGLDYIHALEDYEIRVSDRFYSWGWRSSNSRVLPLAPALPPRHRTRGVSSRKTLLCCMEYPRDVYRLHFQPMPGSIERMYDETLKFVRSSTPGTLAIRPSTHDYGWSFLDAVRREVPDAPIYGAPLPYRSFHESALVVHSYFVTSWLETLALDVPTVCFFDSSNYVNRPSATPYLEALERVGVLHRSGEDAARFVNGLANDVDAWWLGADVRAAREAFVHQFANFSSDWVRLWRNAFTEELEAAA